MTVSLTHNKNRVIAIDKNTDANNEDNNVMMTDLSDKNSFIVMTHVIADYFQKASRAMGRLQHLNNV